MSDLRLTRPARDAPPRLVDYDRKRATFTLTAPERYNPVLAIVESWAREDPDAPAVLTVDAQSSRVSLMTAAQLAAASRRAARALLAAGIGKGDRVFVMLPRVPEWYAALLGAMRIGAVPMPGPNLLTPHDIADRLTRANARAAVTDAPGAVKVDAAGVPLDARFCTDSSHPPNWTDFTGACDDAGDGETAADPTHRDDPLLLYFTSGTVSLPKMVLHRQDYALGHVGTARFWHDLRPGDLHWTVTDTGWAKAAWGGLFGQFHERACVMQVALGKPDADTILGILERHGVTSFCAPPTLYRLLVQTDLSRHDLSTLRHCTSAGEPLNPEVIRAWRQGTGLTIYDGYGQTETTCLVANYRALEVRAGSMGKPVPGWEIDVVDDHGRPVPTGEVGNVVVVHSNAHQTGLFLGYDGDPEATAAVMRGPLYFTGDKAAKDPDGYFWFEGRSDDVITSSAYRIGPFEVESALIAHPAVMEAAVVGRDDPQRTQIVVAICILAPGHSPSAELAAELQEFVKQQTAPYKYPREVHFVDSLPKTVSGKIRRGELREWLRPGGAAGL
ncbi:MAG: AMP-binding protein [Acidobacteriota bacterium]|nr:AMP-binding protein [Acidobacteriota bacterium]